MSMQEERHDLCVHVQYHHDAMPPYQGTIEEIHGWLHDDAEMDVDKDHGIDEIILPPYHMYPAPRRRRSRHRS